MSEPCSIEMCKSPSRTQCHCCRKNFCRTHFIEHDNLPNVQLNLLVDEINLLNDRVAAFNIGKLAGDSYQKLEQWRADYHKKIDHIFDEKHREIDQRAKEKLKQQRDKIAEMRLTIAELIRKQETTMKDIDLMKADIYTADEKINKMEQTCYEVFVRPLVIDDTLIHIKELYIPQLDLSILPPPYKTINRVCGSSASIASNDRFFLIHQAPNLCLMDRELAVLKRSQWNHGFIYDMCWSSTLFARFFVVTEANVFIVNDVTMSIESIQIDQGHNWFSCTCSDTSLYLSTSGGGTSILKFSLFPSIQLEKRWTSPEMCTKSQAVTDVVYENESLALTIVDIHKEEELIELRSSTTLERLWSLRLDVGYDENLFRCCPLNHGEWLAWKCNESCYIHITKDGKLQVTSEYNKIIFRLILFDGDQLAISSKNDINFHKIKS